MGEDQVIDNQEDESGGESYDFSDSFDRAMAQTESQAESVEVDEGGDVDAPEVENADEIEQPQEDIQEPDEYLEELKQTGDTKKAQQFEKLVNSNKELKAERDQYQEKAQNFDVLHDELFVHAGLSPDSLTDMVTVFEAVKNGAPTPEVKQIASNFVLRMAQGGFIDLDGINLYQGHPDIAERVQNLEITDDIAREHIRLREQQRQQEQFNQAQQQFQQRGQQFETDKRQAMQQVASMGQEFRNKNPDHDQVENLIRDDFLAWAQQNPNPQMWPGEYKRLYNITLNSLRYGSNQRKLNSDTNTLGQTGKHPSSEIPALADDGSNLVDRALAMAQNDGAL